MIKTSSGWRAFSCIEATEVLLTDRLTCRVGPEGVGRAAADPLFDEACEPASVLPMFAVVGSSGGVPSWREGSDYIVKGTPGQQASIWVCGVRRNMAWRLREYPPAVAERNNAFWGQAWAR